MIPQEPSRFVEAARTLIRHVQVFRVDGDLTDEQKVDMLTALSWIISEEAVAITDDVIEMPDGCRGRITEIHIYPTGEMIGDCPVGWVNLTFDSDE